MDYIQMFIQWFTLLFEQFAVEEAIMVSTVIALIGLLKPIVFDHIPFKFLRKFLLSLTSVALSFGVTAVTFLWEHMDWSGYYGASAITAALCVLTYWGYENFGLRDGVHKIGNLTLGSAKKIFGMIFARKDRNSVEAEIKKATEQIKATAKSELKLMSKKSYKKDKELENL